MASRGSYVEEQRFGEFDFDIVVEIDEPIITVRLNEVNTGISAQASARRNEPDIFTVDTGKRIALARAMERFSRRFQKAAIRELDLIS